MALYAVLAASLSRTFADLVIFGYVPLYLYAAGERNVLQLGLITAVPALVRFLAANFWGAVSDATGRLKLTLLVGILGYLAASVGLLFVSTGLQAMAVVSVAAAFYAALSPAGKAFVSLRPGAAGTSDRALAWWLQLESWGWALGSAGVALRERLGLSPQGLLVVSAGLLAAVFVWVAWKVPAVTHELLTGPTSGTGVLEAPAGLRTRVLRDVVGRLAQLGAEWRRLYGNGLLALVLGAFGLAILAGEGSFTVFGFYLVGTLGASEALYGTSLTLATLLGLVAYAWLGAQGRRISPGSLMLAGGMLYTVLYATMAAAPTALVAAAAFSVPVYALVRAGATWAAGTLTSASERGGGMGALDGIEALAMTLGALLAGAIGQQWGFRAVYAGCAGTAAVLSLLAWKLREHLTSRRISPVAA